LKRDGKQDEDFQLTFEDRSDTYTIDTQSFKALNALEDCGWMMVIGMYRHLQQRCRMLNSIHAVLSQTSALLLGGGRSCRILTLLKDTSEK
jgi:hypothetical protein